MNGVSTCAILGVVTVAAEEKFYGLQEPKRFLEFVVSVEKSTGTAERSSVKRHPFRLACFSQQSMEEAKQLQAGDIVWVTAELTNEQYEKNGNFYDRVSLRARSVERVGQKPTAAAPRQGELAYGATQQQRAGGYTPQRTVKQAFEQRRTPAPLPQQQEEDADIPF